MATSLLGLLVLWGSLYQGLNWDEPWILGQARLLASHQATEPFKPLAGLLALPFARTQEPWLPMRLAAFALQGVLAWAIWRILSKDFTPPWRCLALAMLWLEPTFRERALEFRTEVPALITLCLAILIWRREWPRIPSALAGLPLAVGLGLAPKTVLWVASWFILVVLSDGKSKEFWKRTLGAAGWSASVLVLLWCGVSLWTHRHPLDLFLAAGRQNHLALSSGVLFPPQARFYLLQTLWAGWPFYGLAILGLIMGRLRSWAPQTRDFLGCCLLPWLLVPVYSGAFPYHFVGLIPPLLPAAVTGLQALMRRFGTWGLALPSTALLISSLTAATTVFYGPGLREQSDVLHLAEGYLQPGLGYVDGVGMLTVPQSAFFVTSLTAESPAAAGLLERWKQERVSLFVLDGRTELLLRGDRLDWALHHFVRVHPNLLVLGVMANGDKELHLSWRPPWEATFQFVGTPGWSWTLNGQIIPNGTELRLPPSDLQISGLGPGPGRVVLALKPQSTRPARPVVPFFLPFQRP